MEKQSAEVAEKLKLLSHPARLKILCHLVGGPKTVGELMELCGTTQVATSQFLAVMRTDRLVASERDGQFVRYRIGDVRMVRLIVALKEIFCD